MPDSRPNDVSENHSRASRTIVLCFDGTNGQYEAMNTNVVKLFGLLRKDCPEQQIAYYQPGIGTYFASGVVSPLWTHMASLLDEAVAWYLDAHVMGGYKFLMDNYRAGDKICLFGFSRGAYTARALAGMLDKVGLLLKGNLQQVNFAYKAYTRTDKKGIRLAAGFKKTFSQDVKIDFLGVWDTVQSTGVLVSRELPFTDTNNSIKVFRHALSLDERRARFRPKLYHWPTRDEDDTTDLENQVTRRFDTVKSTLERLFKRKNRPGQPHQGMGYETLAEAAAEHNEPDDDASSSSTHPKDKFCAQEVFTTDVLEVWFSGGHSDVGGGNVEDSVDVSLAQIPLHWMVEQIMQSKCGILFDSDKIARTGFLVSHQSAQQATHKVDDVAPVTVGTAGTQDGVAATPTSPSSWGGTEGSDATAPLFDQLKINRLWWILEVLPVSVAWQDRKRVWHSQWSVNMGRGRFIPFEKPKFHRSVKERMECESLKYKPRAVYDHDEVYV